MPIQEIEFSDRDTWMTIRGADVTASVAAAVLGLHEFVTPYALWALKTGRLKQDPEETAPMRRGRLLEPVAVQVLREENPDWMVTHNTGHRASYFRDPDARIGATPDVLVRCPRRGFGIVQVKSVEASVFRQKWGGIQSPEVPTWIAIQATIERELTGAEWAAVAPLVIGHGVELPLIEIPHVPGLYDRVKQAVAEFWNMVAAGREPSPDYAEDIDTIGMIYRSDDGGETDLSTDNRIHDLIADRAAAKAAEKAAKKQADAIDAEIKDKLRDAAVAYVGGGKKITWKTVHRAGYEVQPTSYRMLRVPGAD